MGVQPRPTDYRPLDHFCWPAGQTPWTIKVFFAGITFGGGWVPGDGTPSNGYFDMDRVHAASNKWSSGLGSPAANLEYTGAHSKLTGRSTGGELCFLHQDLHVVCKKYMSNSMNPAIAKFGHGQAWVTGYDFPWEIADLVMDAYWKDPRYEVFPMPGAQLAIRVARIHDGTNIIIKFDSTL